MTAGNFPRNGRTKSCVACGALMPEAATKCTKCNSYQNWHNRLTISTTVLALLTALVSVIGATIPNLWSWYKSGNSHVVVSFAHDDNQGGFSLAATNDGDRIGSIASVTVEFVVKEKPYSIAATLDQRANPSVEPGKSQKIRYELDVGTELVAYSPKDVVGECLLKVEVREFAGTRSPTLRRKCTELRPLDFGLK
ncbi:hypothetical protein [Bradyrhizobium sp. RDI18]|uniref:hypothetical protein n=1 Tax=Bradyrhizobium sp. RDI18 TaxID=3367400 RepID=UPI0037113985